MSETPEKSELEIIQDQLDELLAEGPVDEDDAIEIAALAGLAERLGASKEALADAVAWRNSEAGSDLLKSAWDEMEIGELVGDLEGVAGGDFDEEEVENTVFEFDEVVAAALWSGRSDLIRKASARVDKTIRDIPEPFASLADYAKDLVKLPGFARHMDVYAYWLAIAEASAWSDDA